LIAMQTESKSERVVKSLRESLLIDMLDAQIATAQHFARVTQEELEQLDLKTTDPKQKLLISPFGSIRWSRHLMALLYARQQAMLFMMDACARQLGEDSPFNEDPLFIEQAGTSSYEHYERALMFAMGARPTTSGPSGRSGSRVAPSVMPGHRARSGSAASRTAQRGSRSNRGRFVELYAHDDQDSPMPPHDCGGYNGTPLPEGAHGHASAGSNAGACGTHAPGAGETPALRRGSALPDDEGNFPEAFLLQIAEWMQATDEWMAGPRTTLPPAYPADAYAYLREKAPTYKWARDELELVEKYRKAHAFDRQKRAQGPGGGPVTPDS